MDKFKKLASGFENVYDVVMGKGFKSPADQVLKEYPGLYIHSILTSRQ